MTKLLWKGFCTNEDVQAITQWTDLEVCIDFGSVMLVRAI